MALIFVLQNLASVNEVTPLMLYPKMPAQSSSKLPLTHHFVPRPFFPVELRVTALLTFFSAQHRVTHAWFLTRIRVMSGYVYRGGRAVVWRFRNVSLTF